MALMEAQLSCGTSSGSGTLSSYCATSSISPDGNTRQNSGRADPTLSVTLTCTGVLDESPKYWDSPGIRALGMVIWNQMLSRPVVQLGGCRWDGSVRSGS